MDGEGFLKKHHVCLAVLRVFDVFSLDPGRSISFRNSELDGYQVLPYGMLL